MNKKLKRLEEDVEKAKKKLRKYVRELETRTADPNFSAAEQLFEAGWQVFNWRAILVDTEEEIIVRCPEGREFYFADGVNSSTELALEHANAEDDAQFEFLSDLCEEAGLWSPS